MTAGDCEIILLSALLWKTVTTPYLLVAGINNICVCFVLITKRLSFFLSLSLSLFIGHKSLVLVALTQLQYRDKER
jgi:hypothetical protein